MKQELQIPSVTPNMPDYDLMYRQISWEKEYNELDGLPGDDLNLAHT